MSVPASPQISSSLAKGSRIIVLAPHPDDESLGAGGLIQQALAAGAEVRVAFITNGDNNPWPQRWIERRWKIDGDCRARLGDLRKIEALRAMNVLGLDDSKAEFFHLPDAGLLPLWRQQNASALQKFVDLFSQHPPDIVIPPSPHDRHPDHQASYYFAEKALETLGQRPLRYSYLIHPGWLSWNPTGTMLHLSPAQMAIKLQAILCHETQTALSRGRFSSYATQEEMFILESPTSIR